MVFTATTWADHNSKEEISVTRFLIFTQISINQSYALKMNKMKVHFTFHLCRQSFLDSLQDKSYLSLSLDVFEAVDELDKNYSYVRKI